jgi:HAD superfamily hydrolase (TIGR01490 family)
VIVQRDVDEVAHLKDVRKRVAAFFDLDGTLVPEPSMEKRLFSMLRCRQLIGFRNYFWWAVEAARLAPRGINQVMHADKMYLRGVRRDVQSETETLVCLGLGDEARSHGDRRGQARRRQASMPVPFCRQAIERVAWHAERGHLLVIVSGTLAALAETAGRALEHELSARGLPCKIRVCATRLEEQDGRWTGRILGQAMFGEAKAQAIARIALEADLDLPRCFGYGDSSGDRWMLEAVGKPAAVNPSNDLERIARRNDWIVLRWGAEKNSKQKARPAQSAQKSEGLGKELPAGRMRSGYGA